MYICKTIGEIYSDKYPYLIVKVYVGVCMPMYINSSLSVKELIIIGLEIYEKNKLESCVVQSDKCSFYIKSHNLVEVCEDCPTSGMTVSNSDFENKIVYEHTEEDITKIKSNISNDLIWQEKSEDGKSFKIKRFIFPNGTYYP